MRKFSIVVILFLVMIAPALAQSLMLDGKLREPFDAVFSTKSASVMMTGQVHITTTPEEAAKEAAEQVNIDCDKLVAGAGAGVTVYTMEFDVHLVALNNYKWSVFFKPNGEVIYENITPSESADRYFRALARELSCKSK